MKETWYDEEEEDILGVHISDKGYWKSVELPNGIVIDIAKDGTIVGMEIMHARKIFSGDFNRVLETAKIPA